MTGSPYVRFLPERLRAVAASVQPTTEFWRWPAAPATRARLGDVDVHLACARNDAAAARVLLVHGAGGHSGLVWPFAAILADAGWEVIAPDLPLYGRTRVLRPGRVRYRDWVGVLGDLVAAETADDPRPLVLFGASMGGLLSYEVAHRTRAAAAVAVTCLLDIGGDPEAARCATKYPIMARTAPLLRFLPAPFTRVRAPITMFAPIEKMSRDPALSRVCARDPLGAAGRLPLGLVADLVTHRPPAPETYRGARIDLVHPGADDWTPPAVSERFAARIAGAVTTRRLTGCGHFPVEDPGVAELEEYLRELLADVADPT